jgi:exopolyphosphatase/guanosine-5'-triphosphate,3'-diphosphate pyrophosphatase
MIAETARYHRKAPPGPDDQPFAVLLPPVQRVVETLAALLRLADGLDRRHAQVVENLRAEASGERITVHLEARRAPTIEIRAALRKADLARRVFGREIRLKAGQASASGVDEQVDGSMVGVHE